MAIRRYRSTDELSATIGSRFALCSFCRQGPDLTRTGYLRCTAHRKCWARTGGNTPSPADDAGVVTDPAQWTMAAGDYASTRFSRLDEINTTNVSRLKVAWSFSTGAVAGHEAAPLVVGGTMFLITPFPNVVYALDLARPGAPVKWKYDPAPLGAAKGVACCDVVNRGVAYWNNSIIFNTLDGRTIAVDAATGVRKWE